MGRGERELLQVKDVFGIVFVVMVSWVQYIETSQIIHLKYM